MISEVMSFVCLIYVKLVLQDKKSSSKVQADHLLKVFQVPEQCTGIFKVSNS